ncbi:MAG: ATP-binding cassette domain-containing protein [Gammaproteobacteria bacterium]|nr:MAG: ATP-binding cassette domain-containing protein [Gammaproteobacteria bacterium]
MIELQHYHRLVRKLASHWKLLLLALGAMLIMAATLALLPILVKHMLDGAFIRQNLSLIQTTSLTMIAVLIVRALASYASRYAAGKASGKLGIDLRMAFFDKLLTLPVDCYAHFNQDRIGALITHIDTIAQTTTGHFARLTQDCLTVIALVLCTLYLNQEFAILLLLVTPLIVLIHQMTQSRCNKPGQKGVPITNNLIEHLAQSVAHYRKIRLDGGQNQESQRLNKISESIFQAEMQQVQTQAITTYAGQIIIVMIMIAVAYVLALQAINGTLSLPEIAALITIVLLLILPMQRTASLPRHLQHNHKALDDFFAFLDLQSEQDTGTLSLSNVSGRLIFDQVYFASGMPAKPVLNRLHFTVRPGEAVAITGYSAEEKNALLDLILRLRQPTGGKITLDDHPLPDIRLSQLHANIALVSSDTFLLDDKIAGNIAYGAMRCSDEAKITSAAQTSRAIGFIRRMPDGLQTKIGPAGTAISKKQAQQLAIARALVKNPPVLILDELFSPPQPDDGNLLTALEELMQNRTTLIFNQSVPQLQRIDRIFVMENGCMTENLKG